MNVRKAIKANLRLTTLIFMLGLLPVGGSGQAPAGGWFKAAAGVSGMAMDDVNNANFSFYDYGGSGFDFPELNSGFSLSFHLGYDLSPDFSLGFSWDRQYARVDGTDGDVSANLNLDANLFMGHLYWTPLRNDRWNFGAAAGLGPIFADGKVKVTGQNNVNYGEGETSGSAGLALEAMALVDFKLKKSMVIELTAGYRSAVIKDFKYENRPVSNADGSPMELDYTGYIIKAGIKFLFGGDG